MERAVRLTGAVTGATPERFWPYASRESAVEPVTTSQDPARPCPSGTGRASLAIRRATMGMPAAAAARLLPPPIAGMMRSPEREGPSSLAAHTSGTHMLSGWRRKIGISSIR